MTVTIAEFLNARLTEDMIGAAITPPHPEWHDRMNSREHLLRDIEVKRRIVERAWLSVQYLPPEMRTTSGEAAAFHAFWILAELASVYADHPDYNPDWKP